MTADTELSFEYMVKPRAERVRLGLNDITELPFQVQIHYTRIADGSKYVRVISQSKPVSKDRRVCEASAKIDVLSSHAMQTSGFLAGEGDYTTSRVHNRAMQKMMQRCSKTPTDDRVMQTWTAQMGALDKELRSEMMTETLEEADDNFRSAEFDMGGSNTFRLVLMCPCVVLAQASMWERAVCVHIHVWKKLLSHLNHAQTHLSQTLAPTASGPSSQRRYLRHPGKRSGPTTTNSVQ